MSRFDLTTPEGRRRANRDYLWNDHAFLRVRFQNAHWISDELVRTNQPSPRQLKAWRDGGIKTIINLRGGFDSSFYALEKEACEQLGLKMVDFTVTSREAPSKVQIRGAKALFQTIEYPALMHCKSGADRAGIMSVLYMHFRKGLPIREALRQLSFRFLHVRHGKTGVLDYMLERYLEEAEPKGIDFLEWVESDAYDPKRIKEDFKAQWWGTLVTEKLLRRE
jgi:protein tyrosine/serine phosphatase